jgi:hypothetical protein
MSELDILYSKEGFTFAKNNKNNYSLTFQMENKSVILANVIDFSLIKLIYDLNSDIYERVDLKKVADDEAILVLLMKNLFEEMGLPQRFSYVNVKKTVNPDKITFISESIKGERPENLPDEAQQMPLKNMICNCKMLTPHKILFEFNIMFEEYMIVPQIAEKMIGLIIFKIFKRVKQFIENVRM